MNYAIRHYRTGDRLAPALAEEVGELRLSAESCWIAEVDGVAVGYLLAAVAHDIAWMLRLRVDSGADPMLALALIRAALVEFEALGLRGFTVFLSEAEAEQKMRAMMAQAGAVETPFSGVWSTLKFKGASVEASSPPVSVVVRKPEERAIPRPRFILQEGSHA